MVYVNPGHPRGVSTSLLRNTRDRTPHAHAPEDDDARPEPPPTSLPLGDAVHERSAGPAALTETRCSTVDNPPPASVLPRIEPPDSLSNPINAVTDWRN